MTAKGPRVIVALDCADAHHALNIVRELDPALCRVKVGKELFVRTGPTLVEQLQIRGYEVFLDLKFHDIPNTVAQACAAAADLGVWMVNVHALGGRRMLEVAREMLDRVTRRPLLTAVTVLTSMDDYDLRDIGLSGTLEDNVLHLAALAHDAGLDGVVCSAQEASLLRARLGEEFCLVTPGIRPAGGDAIDQKRVVTPGEAVRYGADYLVVGRPITRSDNPHEVLLAINSEIEQIHT